MAVTVRAYRPSDLPAVYDICVRTAHAGGDARGRYASDLLVGDVYAAPYVTLEPEHAHVLDDGAGTAVGYVLGTADTPTFVRRYRAEWIPAVEGRHPTPSDPPLTPDDAMLASLRRPERLLVPEVAPYPAHLHIDVLPGWQGRGHGRSLMGRFLAGLHAAGVAGVHLGVSAANSGARAFYDRLGFREIVAAGPAIYLVRDTGPVR